MDTEQPRFSHIRSNSTVGVFLARHRLRVVPALLLIYVWIRTLTSPPAGSYSLSLFQVLPADLLIAFALVGPSLMLIGRQHIKWTLALASQFLVAIAVIPTLQTKFLFLTHDALVHIGRVNYILETGNFAVGNPYPLLHTLAATISQITGIDPTATAIAILATMSALLAILLVLCVRRLGLSNAVFPLGIFAAIVATIGIDLYNFASWGQYGRVMLALSLLVLLCSPFSFPVKIEWKVLVGVIILATIAAHPLIITFVIVILGVIYIYQVVSGNVEYPLLHSNLILIFSGGVASYWLISLRGLARPLSRIVGSIFLSGDGESRLARNAQMLSSADIAPIDIAIQFIGQYGYVVGFLGSLLVFIALRSLIIGGRSPTMQPLAIGTFVFWGTGTLMFVLPVPFGPGRFWAVAIILGVLTAACDLTAFTRWFQRGKRPVLMIGLIVLLLVYSVAGATVYQSSLTRSASPQITEAEFSGSEWFFKYSDSNAEVRETGVPVQRLMFYQESIGVYRTASKPRPHFAGIRTGDFEGYVLKAPAAGQKYPNFYPEYPETWDYTPEDYEWLKQNPRTNRIYHSGDTYIYKTLI